MANILQLVPNKGWGGGEKCVFDLSVAIRERGDDVHVVIPPCDILAGKFAGFALHVLSVRSPYDPVAVVKLAGLIRRHRIDVVHVHIFKHAMVCLLARALFGLPVRVVMTRHLSRPAKKKLHYNWLYNRIDKIAFVSDCALKRFLTTSPRISSGKLAVVHNGIPVSDAGQPVDPAVSEICEGPDGKILKIGFAGRIVPEKGLEALLPVLGELKRESGVSFLFLIAGTGTPGYLALLEDLIRCNDLSANVLFLGFIQNTIGFFKNVDIAVAPSLVEEAFSLTVLEAMAAATAIVAADGSQREQLQDGLEGILVDPRDSQRLKAALCSLLRDDDLRRRLAGAARCRFEREFIFPHYVEQIYSVLYENGKQ